MNDLEPSLISRIYNWIYGYKEEEYVTLNREHRPSSECWKEGENYHHLSHIAQGDKQPSLAQLAALGNHLSDRIEWLFEAIGKISLTQAKVTNETRLRLDLIDNTLARLDNQIPENFGQAFIQIYGDLMAAKEAEDKLVMHLESLSREVHKISLKTKATEKATSANLNPL